MADTFEPKDSAGTRPQRRGWRRRVNRWDRPPEPRDWRWAVGHLGRALITLGLMMFGFVGYQLWGTGLQTARAQDHLKSEFKDQLSTAGITQDTLGPATSTTSPTNTTTPATPDTGAGVPATTIANTNIPDTTLPGTTTTTPVQQIYGNVKPGDSLGEIRIPRIDLDFYIVAGVSKDNLNDGVGHFPNTPLPGQYGNSALAGHRTSHLAPFGDLDLLKPGDEVQIFTRIGGAFVYIVTDSVVVNPSDYYVVTDSDPSKATLTLITCTPRLSSKQRLVVHATLDTTRGSPVGAPLIYYGQDPPAVAPVLPDEGTDISAPDSATAPSTSAATASTADSTPAAVVSSPDTATSTATAASTASTVDPADEFADDAFSQGWFDDGAAWPHVIGWAAAFALAWYGAYRLAKRFRNSWIGFAVGIVPFLVTLFFLYENVNRLLPAAI